MKAKTILKRGERKEVHIESIAPGGEGVSKDFGLPVFIEKAAVGDRLLVEIGEAKSNFARGSIVEVLRPSNDRVEPPCQLFDRCGGCQWQHLSYPAQLKAKADIIKQSFRHIAKLPIEAIEPVIGAPSQLSYRNKAHFLAASSKTAGALQLGYYATASHNLVEVDHCPVQPDSFDQVFNQVRKLCQNYGISVYDERSRKGLLRSVGVRHSEASGEILVTLVLNCHRRDMSKKFLKIAQELIEMPKVKGVCANFHSGADGNPFGGETVCLAGKPHITEILKSERQDFPEPLTKGLRF
jgi:23S rRNA (uracil1939-C5)-methyltransferase